MVQINKFRFNVFAGMILLASSVYAAPTQGVIRSSSNVQIVVGMNNPADYRARLIASHTLGRSLTADDVAALYGFLAQQQDTNSCPVSLMAWDALKNDALEALFAQPTWPPDLLDRLREMHANKAMDSVWRDYCFQHIGKYAEEVSPRNTQAAATRRQEVLGILQQTVAQDFGSDAGRALLALEQIAIRGAIDRRYVADNAARIAASTNYAAAARLSGLQTAARLGATNVLPVARSCCSSAQSTPMQLAAIAALGYLGDTNDLVTLAAVQADPSKQILHSAAMIAEKRIQDRLPPPAANTTDR